MKWQTIPFLLSIFINASGQQQKTVSLAIATTDCRINYPYALSEVDGLFLFKLPEDTLAFKAAKVKFRRSPILINNVPLADYRLEYRNNFRQKASLRVSVNEKDTNYITICPDSLLDYPQHTLAKLQDKDTIVINFRSHRCFNFEILKLVITKESDQFIARLYTGYLQDRRKKPNSVRLPGGYYFLKKTVLTKANIIDFTRFENELNFEWDDGCTTTSWYDVKSRYLTISRTGGDCIWDGFHYLKKSLFGEKD